MEKTGVEAAQMRKAHCIKGDISNKICFSDLKAMLYLHQKQYLEQYFTLFTQFWVNPVYFLLMLNMGRYTFFWCYSIGASWSYFYSLQNSLFKKSYSLTSWFKRWTRSKPLPRPPSLLFCSKRRISFDHKEKKTYPESGLEGKGGGGGNLKCTSGSKQNTTPCLCLVREQHCIMV